MRKYNKFLALVLCVSMALPFTGCSSSKDNKESTSSETKKDDDKEDGNKEEEYVREADVYKDLDFSKYVTTGDYASIQLSKKDIDNKTDEMVQTNIERTDSYKKDKKSKIKEGDTVNIFYVGKMDGKELMAVHALRKTLLTGITLK